MQTKEYNSQLEALEEELRLMLPALLQEQAQDLIEEYLLGVTELADEATVVSLQYYEELKPRSLYVPEPYVDESLEPRLRRTVQYAVSEASPDAESILNGAGIRAIRDQSRSTLITNVQVEGGRWGRIPAADACGFCRLLGVRGPVYKSQNAAMASHNNCRCQVGVERPGMSYTRPKYMAGWNDEYEAAKSRVSERRQRQSLKNIVREWNKMIRHPEEFAKGLNPAELDIVNLDAA
ncbi:hypothetical protein [Mycobacterium phage Maco6]|nr:hypothetical protein [Mycobacterium phage Maco7]UNY41928.1 hypothetical protein [Mycobacterium phage Maco6]